MSTPFLPQGKPMAVVNEDGTPIAGGGGGGGTQYTEGDVDATITGGAVLFEDTGDTLRVVSATNRLPVSLPAGGAGLTDAELRASPVAVTGGGGGTEYTEGTDTDATPTGGAIIWKAAGNAMVAVSAANPLPVVVQEPLSVDDNGGSLTVDGTVSLATNTPDVTDRDARLLGRAKLLDASGAVIDPALKGQLPAALVGGRLSVDASAVAVPVTDNAGSLTVDAPVGTPAFVRLSDGTAAIATLPVSLATNTPDVTDRDARLAGRVKNLDSTGAVIDPALKGQLPAALVGGRLDVNIGAPATLPVSLATNTPDVTDRAARELGRARIWDGTDEATVLPLRTQPATTEKAQTFIELPTRMPTYATTTAEIAQAITIGVKEGLAIYNNSALDIYIVEIWYSFLVTTASTTGGRTTVRLSTITTAPTGGTELGKANVSGAAAASISNTMQVKTGGGAIGTTFVRRPVEYATSPIGTMVRESIFVASSVGSGLILRASGASGVSIDTERVVAHTALVDQWTYGVRWIEL